MASTGVTDTSIPVILPQAGQTYADPAMELATRNILATYFGDPSQGNLGMMGQPIPIPIQQVAGLSPLEVQARNAAQGLGGFIRGLLVCLQTHERVNCTNKALACMTHPQGNNL